MKAVVRALARARAARRVVAVPVAASDTIEALSTEVDEVVCLLHPEGFGAVGVYYDDFAQTTDEEVIELLKRAAAFDKGTSSA